MSKQATSTPRLGSECLKIKDHSLPTTATTQTLAHNSHAGDAPGAVRSNEVTNAGHILDECVLQRHSHGACTVSQLHPHVVDTIKSFVLRPPPASLGSSRAAWRRLEGQRASRSTRKHRCETSERSPLRFMFTRMMDEAFEMLGCLRCQPFLNPSENRCTSELSHSQSPSGQTS